MCTDLVTFAIRVGSGHVTKTFRMVETMLQDLLITGCCVGSTFENVAFHKVRSAVTIVTTIDVACGVKALLNLMLHLAGGQKGFKRVTIAALQKVQCNLGKNGPAFCMRSSGLPHSDGAGVPEFVCCLLVPTSEVREP